MSGQKNLHAKSRFINLHFLVEVPMLRDQATQLCLPAPSMLHGQPGSRGRWGWCFPEDPSIEGAGTSVPVAPRPRQPCFLPLCFGVKIFSTGAALRESAWASYRPNTHTVWLPSFEGGSESSRKLLSAPFQTTKCCLNTTVDRPSNN